MEMRERSWIARSRELWSAVALLCLAGCGEGGHGPVTESSPPPPIGQPAGPGKEAAKPTSQPAAKYVTLPQNWNEEERLEFYFTTQGSQILPYDWFLVLEQPDSTTLFRDDANMLKYGYMLEEKDTKWNPDGLPVGFVKDDGRDRNWLGLNCSACHTSQVDYKGVSYRIDGGATLADVKEFLFGVTAALKATRDKEDKLLRFAKVILGAKDSAAERETLKQQLTEIINQREGYNARNFPTEIPPLPGRVDAFGAILNEVYHHVVPAPVPSNTANTAPASAPVSYPFLWDTPQHDVVQWNGAAKNGTIGSVGRNVGEVLGVFGKFEIPEKPSVTGYSSTVKVRNLRAIEEWLKKLWSPQWPAGLGELDKTKVAAGRAAWEKAKCNVCHEDIKRDDPARHIEAKMVAVGTDPQMTVNFGKRFASTGKLEGAFVKVIGSSILGSKKLGPKAGGDEILSHVVIGTIIGSAFPAPEDELSQIDYKRKKESNLGPRAPVIGGGGTYKARPLNGIWATAPYLHNGSVPTLYHLLLPAKDRPRSFSIGSREFDPRNVGYRIDAPGFPVYRARTEDGNAIPGNSNEGHEFGTDFYLNKDEQWALIEYLKSL
jgi:hypothetical protein